MCACCQKKSFFIKDILKDISVNNTAQKKSTIDPITRNAVSGRVNQAEKGKNHEETSILSSVRDSEEPRDGLMKQGSSNNGQVDVEHRRNTYPLYPTALRVNLGWPGYGSAESFSCGGNDGARHLLSYFSDPMLSASPILRSQLAANKFMPHLLAMQTAYGLDRVSLACKPWWGAGARRKGGQVRFSAAQTGALERRFGVGKYLSPDERRALASTLSLSDRQVKTWFQNRRAKWRRTASDAADAGSPVACDYSSDIDVQIADED